MVNKVKFGVTPRLYLLGDRIRFPIDQTGASRQPQSILGTVLNRKRIEAAGLKDC
jgi:hypothetical protein